MTSSLNESNHSMSINDLRPSGFPQHVYMNNAYLSNSTSNNTTESSGINSSVHNTTEVSPTTIVGSNFVHNSNRTEIHEQEQNSSFSDGLIMMNQAVSNLQNLTNQQTCNSLAPNNSGLNYYELYSSQPQNVPLTNSQSGQLYASQEFNKLPYVNGMNSSGVEYISREHNENYSMNDYTHPEQTTTQLSHIVRSVESDRIHNCPPNFNNYKIGYGSNNPELRSRYVDTMNRPGRQNYLTYQMVNQEESFSPGLASRTGVDLLVSNLDYNIGAKEWRKILITQLQTTIKNVHSVTIQAQADGSNCAIVKVGTIEDARLAISHFHRKKIGYKRIQMNIITPNGIFGARGLKTEVVSLLRSVSGNSLPVCKFIDLFEKRFHRSISVSDLYKMRDIIEIKEQPGNQGGRLVVLSSRAQRLDGIENNPSTDIVVCRTHCLEGSPDYIRAIDSSILPCVNIPLNLFRQQVLKLLQTHGGSMPLMSFPACYKDEFGELNVVNSCSIQSSIGNAGSNNAEALSVSSKDLSGNDGPNILQNSICTDGQKSTNTTQSDDSVTRGDQNKCVNNEQMQVSSSGVPIEHLITCVPSVRIHIEINGVKKIIQDHNLDSGITNSCQSINSFVPPNFGVTNGTNIQSSPTALIDQLHQFSREVVDLLKHQPGCQMLLSKFIPNYHHHFGKQCRVADYGYSKLHELIDALPNVVHVMGSGHLRLLTLSHRVQIRRFTNELIKVLKSQSTKSCRLEDYPVIYKRIYRKEFRITDYGVCYLTDMLSELSDNAVEITGSDTNAVVSLPKRVQTAEERDRTELFAIEVADLLCQSPRCRLPFNKFIPSYHHHFSRQCRVADYGFTKLADLLEAVPNVVKIIEENGEKYVTLVCQRHLQIVAEQLLTMLEAAPGKRIPLDDLINVYMKHQGYALCLEDFQMSSVKELLSKLPRLIRIESLEVPENKSTNKSYTKPMRLEEDQQSNDQNRSVEADEKNKHMTKSNSGNEQISQDTANCDNPQTECRVVEYVCLADRAQIKHLAHKVLLVLLDAPTGALTIASFSERFRCTFRDEPNMNMIHEELGNIVEFRDGLLRSAEDNHGSSNGTWNETVLNNPNSVNDMPVEKAKYTQSQKEFCSSEEFSQNRDDKFVVDLEAPNTYIALKPLIMFARELRELLRQNQGKILLVQLCAVYQRRFGIPLRPQRYNYPSLATLLQAVDFVAVMRGRGVRCTLLLCQDFLGKLSYRVAYNTKPVLELQKSDFSMNSDNMKLENSKSGDNSTDPGNSSASATQPTQLVSWSEAFLPTNHVKSVSSENSKNRFDSLPTLTQQGDNIYSTYYNSTVPSQSTSLNSNLMSSSTFRQYSLPYANYSLGTSAQINSFATPSHFNSASNGYYHMSTHPTGMHHPFITRPDYVGAVLSDNQSTFTYVPNGSFNGAHFSSDCHLCPPNAYNPVGYPSQSSSCVPLTVISPTQTSSNPNFIGPSGETSNSGIPYPNSLYPTTPMYPFSMGMAYTTPLHQVNQQQINCNPSGPNLSDNRVGFPSQNALNSNMNIACSVRPLGHSYYGRDKVPTSAVANMNTITLGHSGLSPAVQQQLDELVERLAYDNANGNVMGAVLSSNRTNEIENEKFSVNSSITTDCNQLPITVGQQVIQSSNQPLQQTLNHSDPAEISHYNTFQASVLPTCLPTHTPAGTYVQINPFSNTSFYQSAVFSRNGLPQLPGSTNAFPNRNSELFTNEYSNNSPNGNIPVKKLSVRMCDSNANGLSDTQSAELSVRNYEDMSLFGKAGPSIGIGSAKNQHVSLPVTTSGVANTQSLYTALNPDHSNFSLNQCDYKQIPFVNNVQELPVCPSSDAISSFLVPNQTPIVSKLSLANTTINIDKTKSGDSSNSVPTSKERSGEKSDLIPQSELSKQISVSSDYSEANFTLRGLMADLRLETKVQQPPSISVDSVTEQKQNTSILLSNFNYL